MKPANQGNKREKSPVASFSSVKIISSWNLEFTFLVATAIPLTGRTKPVKLK
jgi:hypothetical protein